MPILLVNLELQILCVFSFLIVHLVMFDVARAQPNTPVDCGTPTIVEDKLTENGYEKILFDEIVRNYGPTVAPEDTAIAIWALSDYSQWKLVLYKDGGAANQGSACIDFSGTNLKLFNFKMKESPTDLLSKFEKYSREEVRAECDKLLFLGATILCGSFQSFYAPNFLSSGRHPLLVGNIDDEFYNYMSLIPYADGKKWGLIVTLNKGATYQRYFGKTLKTNNFLASKIR